MRGVRLLPAVLWSLCAHGVLALILAPWLGLVPRGLLPGGGAPPEERALIDVSMELPDLSAPPPRAPGSEAGTLAATVPGAADAWSADPASPFPNADLNVPDPRAAAQGGGAAGGASSFTGRHDPDELRSQLWNSPDAYRTPRQRTADARSAREWKDRTPTPGLDDAYREPRRRARDGAKAPPADAATGWHDLDPRWNDGGRAVPTPPSDDRVRTERSVSRLAEDGDIVARAGQPLVDDGTAMVEAEQTGPTRDDMNVTQAADEKHAQALELTKAKNGGEADGVAGDAGDGTSAKPVQGEGDGGSSADLARRNGGRPSTRARAQDAYFKKLYGRVLDAVQFPPELAIALEQGHVVVSFTLFADGTVSDVKVTRSSGFQKFDAAVITAIRHVAPFEPMPRAIAGGRSSVKISAPFVFDNPLIR